jgi:hypothetical protein
MRPIEVLYRLQQTELRLEAIRRDLATLDSGERLEAEMNRLSEELARDRQTLRQLRQELLDQELELNDMEARCADGRFARQWKRPQRARS